MTDSLFDAGGAHLQRLGAAAKLLPSPLVATLSERVFGPLLCARAAASVEPDKAIDVAKRLSPGFLADATVELDPRRVAAIIAGVPTALVEKVARELGRREEHVTMGRFLGYVRDDAIAAAMTALSDEAMLRTAFVLEDKGALDHAVALLPARPAARRTALRLGERSVARGAGPARPPLRRAPGPDRRRGRDDGGRRGGPARRGRLEAGIWESLLPWSG